MQLKDEFLTCKLFRQGYSPRPNISESVLFVHGIWIRVIVYVCRVLDPVRMKSSPLGFYVFGYRFIVVFREVVPALASRRADFLI